MLINTLKFFTDMLIRPDTAIKQITQDKNALFYALIIYGCYISFSLAFFSWANLDFLVLEGEKPQPVSFGTLLYATVALGTVLNLIQIVVIGFYSKLSAKMTAPPFIFISMALVLLHIYLVNLYTKNTVAAAILLIVVLAFSFVIIWKLFKLGGIYFRDTASLMFGTLAPQIIMLLLFIPITLIKSPSFYAFVTTAVGVWVLVLMVRGMAVVANTSIPKAFFAVVFAMLSSMMILMAMGKTGIIDKNTFEFLEKFYG